MELLVQNQITFIIQVIFKITKILNNFNFLGNTLEGFYSRNEAEVWRILQESVESRQFSLPLRIEDQSLPTIIVEAENIELVANDENRLGTSNYNF